MMETVFPECVRLFEEAQSQGLMSESDRVKRDITIRQLVRYAMNQMLHRLMLLQLVMFQENFDETMFMTSGVLIDALTKDGQVNVKRVARIGVKDLLEKTGEMASDRKRDLLTRLMNSLSSFHIPTGPGRPPGTTKSDEQRAREAAEFEAKIEQTIRGLFIAKGKMPTKTRVAEEMAIGGAGSRVNAFNNKIRRNDIDYAAIAARVKLHQ